MCRPPAGVKSFERVVRLLPSPNLIAKPVLEARDENDFLFSRGGCTLRVLSGAAVFDLDQPMFPLSVSIKNDSSKSINPCNFFFKTV